MCYTAHVTVGGYGGGLADCPAHVGQFLFEKYTVQYQTNYRMLKT